MAQIDLSKICRAIPVDDSGSASTQAGSILRGITGVSEEFDLPVLQAGMQAIPSAVSYQVGAYSQSTGSGSTGDADKTYYYWPLENLSFPDFTIHTGEIQPGERFAIGATATVCVTDTLNSNNQVIAIDVLYVCGIKGYSQNLVVSSERDFVISGADITAYILNECQRVYPDCHYIRGWGPDSQRPAVGFSVFSVAIDAWANKAGLNFTVEQTTDWGEFGDMQSFGYYRRNSVYDRVSISAFTHTGSVYCDGFVPVYPTFSKIQNARLPGLRGSGVYFAGQSAVGTYSSQQLVEADDYSRSSSSIRLFNV